MRLDYEPKKDITVYFRFNGQHNWECLCDHLKRFKKPKTQANYNSHYKIKTHMIESLVVRNECIHINASPNNRFMTHVSDYQKLKSLLKLKILYVHIQILNHSKQDLKFYICFYEFMTCPNLIMLNAGGMNQYIVTQSWDLEKNSRICKQTQLFKGFSVDTLRQMRLMGGTSKHVVSSSRWIRAIEA